MASWREGFGADMGRGPEGPLSWPTALSQSLSGCRGVGAEAWEARPPGAAPPHPSPDPVPTLALTGTQTRFSQEPADQTVVAGQRAVLPCVLLNYSGIVQWTKDGLALGMGQGLKGEWGCTGSLAPRWPHRDLPPPPTKTTGLSIHSFPPRSVSGL